jgi:hypothetical protein
VATLIYDFLVTPLACQALTFGAEESVGTRAAVQLLSDLTSAAGQQEFHPIALPNPELSDSNSHSLFTQNQTLNYLISRILPA